MNTTLAFVSCLALGGGVAADARAAEPAKLPGMTYSSLAQLPDWSGWWNYGTPMPDELKRQPLPMRAEYMAAIQTAAAQGLDPDPGRYCRPPQFVGHSGGFIDSVEFLFTPGRVTLTNESGLVRRIYADGRPSPQDPDPSNTGVSIGRWEGATLVIETTGINPKARFPPAVPAAPAIGKNVKITERITLKDASTLEFDTTIVAPDVLTAPDRRTRHYTRVPKKAASEITLCTDYDRAVDPKSGAQRFDMTPPADLPPPPKQ
jgi:hypothetical protein